MKHNNLNIIGRLIDHLFMLGFTEQQIINHLDELVKVGEAHILSKPIVIQSEDTLEDK